MTDQDRAVLAEIDREIAEQMFVWGQMAGNLRRPRRVRIEHESRRDG